MKQRRAKRCVYCKSTCLHRGLILYWRWWCWSCDKIQPQKKAEDCNCSVAALARYREFKEKQ